APAGGETSRPIALILPPSKTSVPFSITGPLTGWIVALVSATGCFCGGPGTCGCAKTAGAGNTIKSSVRIRTIFESPTRYLVLSTQYEASTNAMLTTDN